jgi:hypothetical protein
MYLSCYDPEDGRNRNAVIDNLFELLQDASQGMLLLVGRLEEHVLDRKCVEIEK